MSFKKEYSMYKHPSIKMKIYEKTKIHYDVLMDCSRSYGYDCWAIFTYKKYNISFPTYCIQGTKEKMMEAWRRI